MGGFAQAFKDKMRAAETWHAKATASGSIKRPFGSFVTARAGQERGAKPMPFSSPGDYRSTGQGKTLMGLSKLSDANRLNKNAVKRTDLGTDSAYSAKMTASTKAAHDTRTRAEKVSAFKTQRDNMQGAKFNAQMKESISKSGLDPAFGTKQPKSGPVFATNKDVAGALRIPEKSGVQMRGVSAVQSAGWKTATPLRSSKATRELYKNDSKGKAQDTENAGTLPTTKTPRTFKENMVANRMDTLGTDRRHSLGASKAPETKGARGEKAPTGMNFNREKPLKNQGPLGLAGPPASKAPSGRSGAKYVHPDGTRSTEPPPRTASGRGMTADEYSKHKTKSKKPVEKASVGGTGGRKAKKSGYTPTGMRTNRGEGGKFTTGSS